VFEHLLFSGVLGLTFVLILLLTLLASVLGERRGIPLFLVVLTLALGDNYAHLFDLTMGVLGYVAVIAVCTPSHARPSTFPSIEVKAREDAGLGPSGVGRQVDGDQRRGRDSSRVARFVSDSGEQD
jgi:apolipoprotein N-acyltransferase